MKRQLSILILVLSFVLSAGVAKASMISVLPAGSTVGISDIFTLSITASGFVDTVGGGVDVSWDPSVLSLGSLNDVTITNPTTDPSFTGKGTLSSGSLGNLYIGSFSGFNGDFAIADLTFTAIGAAGTTTGITLSLPLANPWGDFVGNPIAVDFVNASVEVAAIPEPASMLLVGTGLLGLVAIGRKNRR